MSILDGALQPNSKSGPAPRAMPSDAEISRVRALVRRAEADLAQLSRNGLATMNLTTPARTRPFHLGAVVVAWRAAPR
jgi:hypothetical protein